MKKILIYGSKEFGKVIEDIILSMSREFAGFIDDYSSAKDVIGKYNAVRKQYKPDKYEIALGIGYRDLSARWRVAEKIKHDGYVLSTLIHELAYVRERKNIGSGSIIMAGAMVNNNAQLKDLVVMWPGANVNHDAIIGANTFLSPGAVVCGGVTIGSHCFIGANAVIVDHVCVPSESFIRAGTVYGRRLNPHAKKSSCSKDE